MNMSDVSIKQCYPILEIIWHIKRQVNPGWYPVLWTIQTALHFRYCTVGQTCSLDHQPEFCSGAVQICTAASRTKLLGHTAKYLEPCGMNEITHASTHHTLYSNIHILLR